MPRTGKPKPTAGYATQKEAILALHVTGLGALQIAQRLGCSRDTVHVAVAWYRKRTGHVVLSDDRAPSWQEEEALWDGDDDDRRRAIALRAQHGARAALAAMRAEP